ncbi:hypothetical protein BH18CHL2_BH18CHL2_06210 [soil metagenome]
MTPANAAAPGPLFPTEPLSWSSRQWRGAPAPLIPARRADGKRNVARPGHVIGGRRGTHVERAPGAHRPELGITLGEPYVDVHPGNLVHRCTLRDGGPAVIKTEPEGPGEDEFLTGISAMLLYAGNGMVGVLEVAHDDRTVLMERVVRGEPLWREPIGRALEAVASAMGKLRRAPPDGHTFPDVRASHRAWPDHVRLYGGPGPIDAELFDIGERLFVELCNSSAAPVVLHGDLHYGNVLSSEREQVGDRSKGRQRGALLRGGRSSSATASTSCTRPRTRSGRCAGGSRRSPT